MDYLKAFLLGVLQGLTEFLPVSSSGHLIVLQKVLNVQGPVLFLDVMLHGGTLIAILAVFSRDIREVATCMFSKGGGDSPAAARTGWLAVLAALPVGVAGVLLQKWIEKLFHILPLVGGMFLITGVLLFAVKSRKGDRKEDALGVRDALWVGSYQAVALLPGISRSGATIAGGLLRGIDRELAVRFSFLMAIPAILGALILKLLELPEQTGGIGFGPVLLGTVTAALSGYLALRWLIRLTLSGRLYYFSYYLWGLGLSVLPSGFF
ncbi:MAG: undecaprenyl-diphosphate phosphatase [Nitrospinota bacterium]